MLSRALGARAILRATATAAPRRLVTPRMTRPIVRLQHTSKPASAQVFRPLDTFPRRHIGPGPVEKEAMLKEVGVKDIDELLAKAIPNAIRSPKPLALAEGVPERDLLKRLKSVAEKNKVYRSYIGMGYTDTVVPNVILRNVLENPAWYTQVKMIIIIITRRGKRKLGLFHSFGTIMALGYTRGVLFICDN